MKSRIVGNFQLIEKNNRDFYQHIYDFSQFTFKVSSSVTNLISRDNQFNQHIFNFHIFCCLEFTPLATFGGVATFHFQIGSRQDKWVRMCAPSIKTTALVKRQLAGKRVAVRAGPKRSLGLFVFLRERSTCKQPDSEWV